MASLKDLIVNGAARILGSLRVGGKIYTEGKEVGTKEDFQAGVDGIYNAITAQGTTPASKSQSDVKNAIGTLSSNRYSNGYSNGVTDADGRVNSGSASYSQGVTDGRNAQYSECYNAWYNARYNEGYSAAANSIKFASGVTAISRGYTTGIDLNFSPTQVFAFCYYSKTKYAMSIYDAQSNYVLRCFRINSGTDPTYAYTTCSTPSTSAVQNNINIYFNGAFNIAITSPSGTLGNYPIYWVACA